jgi:hypothetical protein
MPDDNFSAVWTRSVTFSPGYYRFNVMSDDGVRVWLDDGLVMDYWERMDYAYHYVDGIYLEGTHRLKVAYFERNGLARIQFWWKPVGTAPPPAAPTPAPTPVPAPVTTQLGPWRGEYFNNAGLSGSPAVVRTDAALGFDWGWGAPVAGINRDNFSVRWTGTFSLEGGRYSFTTTSDDGVRVTVDGQRIIDAWTPMRGTRTGTVTLAGGSHTVQVEYFERLQAAMMRLNVQRLGDGAAAPPAPVPPTVCEGGPLRLDAWYTDRACTATGWKATIYVRGYGGDCVYTYAWEREVKGGPTSGPMTFELRTNGKAMVGEASVTSAGQTAKVGLFIPRPKCD